MTKEEIIKSRNAFADALNAVAKLADEVPSFGWDVPSPYIANKCRDWASGYRRFVSKEGEKNA